jgi:hypothetical protein
LKNFNLLITLIVVALALGFILSGKYPVFNGSKNNLSAQVTVRNTPMVDGTLPVPPLFPEEIPLENTLILESATTYHPGDEFTQLSVSYRSLKTVAEKYEEYKDYMNQAGYNLTEYSASEIKTLFGIKSDASLSINIKNVDGKTLVELSYLLK